MRLKAKKEAKMMGISEDDVKLEEQIQDDFKKAKEIYDRILKELGDVHITGASTGVILFALCLIYSRQLSHHKYEEGER